MILAYLVYSILLLLAILRIYSVDRKLDYLIIAVYTVLIGLRFNVGGDYPTYVQYINEVSFSALELVPYEGLYFYVFRILKYPVLVFVVFAYFHIWLLISIMRVTGLNALFFGFLVSLNLFESISLIRQMNAFLFIIYLYLRHGKWLLSMIKMCISIGLHKSSVALWLLILQGRAVLKNRLIRIIFISAFGFLVSLNLSVADILNVINSDFLFGYGVLQEDLFFESESRIISLAMLVNIIVFISGLMSYHSGSHHLVKLALFIYGMSLLLSPTILELNYIPISRLFSYLVWFKFIVIANVVQNMSRVALFKSFVLRICVVATTGWYYWAIFNQAAHCSPYRFIFI